MTKTDQVRQVLLRQGYISWRRIAGMGVKNPPDIIWRLRAKGMGIESIWTTSKKVNYVKGYAYHSQKVAA